jgi:hypothetical protein
VPNVKQSFGDEFCRYFVRNFTTSSAAHCFSLASIQQQRERERKKMFLAGSAFAAAEIKAGRGMLFHKSEK